MYPPCALTDLHPDICTEILRGIMVCDILKVRSSCKYIYTMQPKAYIVQCIYNANKQETQGTNTFIQKIVRTRFCQSNMTPWPVWILMELQNHILVNSLVSVGPCAQFHETTFLILASKNGRTDTVRFLIQASADVNMSAPAQSNTVYHINPLQAAIQNLHLEIATLLISGSANVNAFDIEGRSPLHFACANFQDQFSNQFVVTLANANANLHAVDRRGQNATHYAARHNNTAAIKCLISHNCDINLNDTLFGYSPLHIATQESGTETVRTLLENKANPNTRSSNGSVPLHNVQNTPIALLLLQHGATVNLPSGNLVYPLHCAALRSDTKLVTELLNANANVNAADIHNSTPLHWAIARSSYEVIKLLVDQKADVHCKQSSPKMHALQMAFHHHRTSDITLALEH